MESNNSIVDDAKIDYLFVFCKKSMIVLSYQKLQLHLDMTHHHLHKNLLALILWCLSASTSLFAQDDVVREDTLEELTVNSRSAQRRLEEVQVGVEKIDIDFW